MKRLLCRHFMCCSCGLTGAALSDRTPPSSLQTGSSSAQISPVITMGSIIPIMIPSVVSHTQFSNVEKGGGRRTGSLYLHLLRLRPWVEPPSSPGQNFKNRKQVPEFLVQVYDVTSPGHDDGEQETVVYVSIVPLHKSPCCLTRKSCPGPFIPPGHQCLLMPGRDLAARVGVCYDDDAVPSIPRYMAPRYYTVIFIIVSNLWSARLP